MLAENTVALPSVPSDPLIVATFDKSDFGKDNPMGRPGQPSEVAPACCFSRRRQQSYISGQIIHINGGEQAGGDKFKFKK